MSDLFDIPQPVVLVTHEDGSREYCKINYFAGRIFESIGFNAVHGDIEKAREILYRKGR